MGGLLHGYEVNEATWFYLSFLLIVAVYYRFTRVFSLRNLDLALLLSASPGLLFVEADETKSLGYVWLFVVACLFLIRLFIDPVLSRRPYLGQNLNSQGLGFLCFCAFLFLMTKAVSETFPDAVQAVHNAGDVLSRTATTPDTENLTAGPAASMMAVPFELVFSDLAAVILVILSHFAVISGLWFVGRNLFGDCNLGLAMATLYLLLPCTAYNVGEVNHVLPAALIIWAFVSYRKPIVAGLLLGLACGTMFFPVVLLPIWAAFYGRKGAWRFAGALCGVAVAMLVTLAMTSSDQSVFVEKTIGTINVALTAINSDLPTGGFWHDTDYLSVYRWPFMTLYFIMLIVMTIWPLRRTVEVLLAQSAAAIVGTQLWYTQNGGVYLLWYFPLMLMVIFRPRLLRHKEFDLTPTTDTDVSVPSQSPAKGTGKTITTGSRLQLFR